MLSFQTPRDLAQISIVADALTLETFGGAIGDVAQHLDALGHDSSALSLLASEMGAAARSERFFFDVQPGQERYGLRFGFSVPWILFLFQVRHLRTGLGLFDSVKMQQGAAFFLESLTEEALGAVFGQNASWVRSQWLLLAPGHHYAQQRLAACMQVYDQWSPQERLQGAAGLLAAMDPRYPDMHGVWVQRGVPGLVDPGALDALAGLA